LNAAELPEAEHGEWLDVLRACRGQAILSGSSSALYDEALVGRTHHTLDLPNHAAGGETKGRRPEAVRCDF
jgi:hypothetical protein